MKPGGYQLGGLRHSLPSHIAVVAYILKGQKALRLNALSRACTEEATDRRTVNKRELVQL